MDLVRAVAVTWAGDAFPGLVQVGLRQADGSAAVITDKAPVFDAGLPARSRYPVELRIPCDVISADAEALVVRLRFGLEDDTGRTDFRVSPADVARQP